MSQCSGECNYTAYGCEGDVKRVRVHGVDNRDWGEFWYCDTAIRIDRANGMTVEVIEPQVVATNSLPKGDDNG